MEVNALILYFAHLVLISEHILNPEKDPCISRVISYIFQFSKDSPRPLSYNYENNALNI
jgi:hypothetical protein